MRDNPELLRCNLCVAQNGAANKTDRLWLKTIRGTDYLICRYHKGRLSDVRQSREDRRPVTILS